MARYYSQVVPVRFTHHQLAQIDKHAATLNLHRSTWIRQSALDNLSKLSAQVDASNEQAFPLANQEVMPMP